MTVNGFSTTRIPLASAGVPAAPSCFVAASPDALATAAVTGGQFEFELTIPNTTSLIGAELHQQLALFEDTPAQPFPWFHASLRNLLTATVDWLWGERSIAMAAGKMRSGLRIRGRWLGDTQ